MNITIICTLYPPYTNGGAEISTQLLAEGLAKHGHRISVITTSSKEEYEVINGVKVYRLKNKNIYWRYPQRSKPLLSKFIWHVIDIANYFYWRKIKNILHDIKPDIVHTNNLCGISTIAWSVTQKLNIPIVHTLRDYYLLCPQQAMLKGVSSCEKQCAYCHLFSISKKNKSKNVNAVVGISDFILKKHLNYDYFGNSIVKSVIPNAVSSLNHKVQKEKKGTSIIGFLGRISPEKGLEYLIDAFSKTNNKGKSLLIAGTGNEEYVNKIKTRYNTNKQIVFLGHINSIDFLSKIDLLIVPSLWHEPFGRVIIEAFSCNVPVFASRNGGLQEIINNKVGRLFDTNNVNTLIELINNFFMGNMVFDDNDFNNVCRIYNNDRIINMYADLYSETITQFDYIK